MRKERGWDEKYQNHSGLELFHPHFFLDFYFTNEGESEQKLFQARIKDAVENAIDKNKIAALTETGNEKIEFRNFFTEYLLKPIKSDDIARKIVFTVVWRNDNPNHHYAPYPGHSSVDDFLDFYNDTFTIFAKGMNNFHELHNWIDFQD